jgi:hypothetical protein
MFATTGIKTWWKPSVHTKSSTDLFSELKKICLVRLLHQTTTQDVRKKEMRPTLKLVNLSL